VLLLGCVMAARAAHVLQTQRGEVGEFLRARLAEKTLCFHVNDRMLLAVVSGQSLEQVEYAMEDWVPDGWLPIPTRASESAMQWGAVLLDPMRDAGATLSELEARLNAPWIRMRLGP